MNYIKMILLSLTVCGLSGCNSSPKSNTTDETFQWQIDQFADIRIMRYQVPGWDDLTPKQKELLYYLSEAALCGRDIIFDQNYKHNLSIRKILESVYFGYTGNRNTEEWDQFVTYLKRVWFSNGIHHHSSTDKFLPTFNEEYFADIVKETPANNFPKELGTQDEILVKFTPIIFDPLLHSKRVNQTAGEDLVATSANNYYEGVSQFDVEQFYAKMVDPQNPQPISYGLNSKLIKKEGQIVEKVWSINGMYGEAIKNIVYWLKKAVDVAENEQQKKVIETLIEYYETGDLKKFDQYNVLWVNDLNSRIDFVNGFIEVYGDPMGYKASWEALVNFTDIEATKRTVILSDSAQWFENHSPIDQQFKKSEVKGVSAKVINATMLGGDCYPATPIGINLPNADWIRAQHGSKSVTIDNITYAYDQAAVGNGFLEEFAWDDAEVQLHRKFGSLAGNLHTDLHECLGHGSGKLALGVVGDELKQYGSPIEESRADLFALYFIMDQKMVDLGIMPSLEVGKAEYNQFIRNGMLTQLTRVELGKDIEQAHMRNRQLIAHWCYLHGKADNVIEKRVRDGKTYFVINDHLKLRQLFGTLLKEIQRIKSTGDFAAAKNLVETYAVKVEKDIHAEVLERFAKLNIAPYGGFVNPKLVPVFDGETIINVKIEYTDTYINQMLEYSKKYSFLPLYN
jgi:dipeptidyl-peptidase-3